MGAQIGFLRDWRWLIPFFCLGTNLVRSEEN